MSIPNKPIVEACGNILNKVKFHRGRERRFLTAYQIWLLLLKEKNPICQILIDNYGTAVGKYGGKHVGPAQRIAKALGNSSEIETNYLDTRRILFDASDNTFGAGGSDCGLFRIR